MASLMEGKSPSGAFKWVGFLNVFWIGSIGFGWEVTHYPLLASAKDNEIFLLLKYLSEHFYQLMLYIAWPSGSIGHFWEPFARPVFFK